MAKRAAEKAESMSKQQAKIAVLTRAKELIEKGWTRGTSARDKGGRQVPPWESSAARFCALGAVGRAEHDLGLPEFWDARALRPFLPRHLSIADFNDTQKSKRPVIALFEKAIASLEATAE